MKKAIFIMLVFCSFASCKKVCYECTTPQGLTVAQKCFNSNEDMYAYQRAEMDKSTGYCR